MRVLIKKEIKFYCLRPLLCGIAICINLLRKDILCLTYINDLAHLPLGSPSLLKFKYMHTHCPKNLTKTCTPYLG